MCVDCCCGTDCRDYGYGPRKILTKTERIEKLKNYAEELKRELVAVDEHVKELSK